MTEIDKIMCDEVWSPTYAYYTNKNSPFPHDNEPYFAHSCKSWKLNEQTSNFKEIR